MKKLIYITVVLIPIALILSKAFFAADYSKISNENIAIDSVLISEDDTKIEVSVSISDEFMTNNEKVYLFSLSPDSNNSISLLIPIAEALANKNNIELSIPFNKKNQADLYRKYLLAVESNGKYVPVTSAVGISNFEKLAENKFDYPAFRSKKGLQVQLTADAQLLSVEHTVISVYVNELMSVTEGDTVDFIYSGKEYQINKTALSMLDYRVKTLTNAGIHIYINLLLAFDTNAPSDLYYSNAKGNDNTLYAINVSDTNKINRISAFINFIAERYSMEGKQYGFCGSYIIGYEVNNQNNSNSADISDISEYAEAYSRLIRAADIAARTAYKNARIFISLSNQWNVSSSSNSSSTFGALDFLKEFNKYCGDVPYCISINPYPSSLSKTDFWNDLRAENSINTEFLTMKNISVLTNYLETSEMQYNGKTRPIIIGEFGLSGKYGEESEKLQSAAYLYAYHIVENNPLIEAFIWHRHVDHSGEAGLYYGLYSGGDLLLSPVSEKLIYTSLKYADQLTDEDSFDIVKIIEYLPDEIASEINFSDNNSKKTIYSSPTAKIPSYSSFKSNTLFDFSKSLYGFYPSDNSSYIDKTSMNNDTFMRINLLHVSDSEYMGASVAFSDFDHLKNSKYISVKLKVISNQNESDFKMLLIQNTNNEKIVLECTSAVKCNDWVTLTFPIEENLFSDIGGNDMILKLWVRGNFDSDKNTYLDVKSVTLQSKSQTHTFFVIFIITLICLIAALSAIVLVIIISIQNQKRRHKTSL